MPALLGQAHWLTEIRSPFQSGHWLGLCCHRPLSASKRVPADRAGKVSGGRAFHGWNAVRTSNDSVALAYVECSCMPTWQSSVTFGHRAPPRSSGPFREPFVQKKRSEEALRRSGRIDRGLFHSHAKSRRRCSQSGDGFLFFARTPQCEGFHEETVSPNSKR